MHLSQRLKSLVPEASLVQQWQRPKRATFNAYAIMLSAVSCVVKPGALLRVVRPPQAIHEAERFEHCLRRGHRPLEVLFGDDVVVFAPARVTIAAAVALLVAPPRFEEVHASHAHLLQTPVGRVVLVPPGPEMVWKRRGAAANATSVFVGRLVAGASLKDGKAFRAAASHPLVQARAPRELCKVCVAVEKSALWVARIVARIAV